MIRDDVVQLDIGGVLFRTTKTTLCSIDGYFAAMFRDGNWAEEKSSHPIFIDRGMLRSLQLSYLIVAFSIRSYNFPNDFILFTCSYCNLF